MVSISSSTISAPVDDGELSPIALFVYNRPEHTRQTITALQKNRLAKKSHLIVFSDGAKNSEDQEGVDEVRSFVQNIDGFRSVTVNLSEHNKGLAKAIIDGVTEVANRYGRVIVLEDDLIVSSSFLDYMNGALEYYSDNDQVMHVSGYWYPIESESLPETFFLRVPSSWGWATWARAWRYFHKDPEELMETFSKQDLMRFNLDGANNFWEQVLHNYRGLADTWAVFWYATILCREGLCLYPSKSLVHNVGLDGSGVHCLKTNRYQVELADNNISVFSDCGSEDNRALSLLKDFYRKNRISRLRRFIVVVCQRLGFNFEV